MMSSGPLFSFPNNSHTDSLPVSKSKSSCVFVGCEDPLDLSCKNNSNANSNSNSNNKVNEARHYGALFVCLKLLERWLELGIRPLQTTVMQHMAVVFGGTNDSCGTEIDNKKNRQELASIYKNIVEQWKRPTDDLRQLQGLVNATRRALWRAALEPCRDAHLIVKPSNIPGAQKGLFATRDLPAHCECCYYSGDIHSTKSSQSSSSSSSSSWMLPDASYLLRIGTLTKRPWWYSALQQPQPQNNSQQPQQNQQGNDEAAAFAALREQWDHIVGNSNSNVSAEEFFVNPSNLAIKARYINDCLREDKYNVKYVLDPVRERAAVVTLRHISAGEELYVSYGNAYWESLQVTQGIVPRPLPDDTIGQ